MFEDLGVQMNRNSTLVSYLQRLIWSAAALWSAAQICAARFADSIRRAGITGEGSELGERTLDGIAPNELTAATDRDPIAGTPWHKSVPARLERLTDAAA